MTVRSYSTTPAANNASPPNGAPEGMLPSGVNNTIRQVMADVRDTFEQLPFFDYGHAPTRIDSDTFTVPTDLTTLYAVGIRLKLVGASTGYATISSSSYSAPDTTVNVTMDSGSIPTALSTVSLAPNSSLIGVDTTLRADLADTTTAGKGNELVSYRKTSLESSVPTPFYEPYDVRRYATGSFGDGSADDTAAFQAAHTAAGTQPVFVPSVGYKWKLSTFVDGNFVSDGILRFVGAGYVKYKTAQGDSVNDNNVSIAGLHWNSSQIAILGDSITSGTGASSYKAGYSWEFARSLMNSVNNGFDYDPGFGYHTIVNLQDAVSAGELTTTGSVSATGLVGSRISLAAGQSITITGKNVANIDVIYDGAVSSGNIVFALNGTTYATKATSGAVLNTTFPTNIIASNGTAGFISESDTVTITASANLVVTGIVALKTSSGGPLLFVASQSGTTFGDFTAAAKITELAFYLNFARSTNEKLLVFALGTNSIYSAGKATTPAQMITDLQTIITGISAACTNVRYAIRIPPRAAEGTWPIITSGYTHADYVLAFEDFARTNNYTLIRSNMSALSYAHMYADGLHPDTAGHRVEAKTWCDLFGINFNPYLKSAVNDGQFNNQVDATYNSTWRSFLNSTANRIVATKTGNTVLLSGIAEPNASVSTTVGTLPAGFRPSGRSCFYTGRSDAGAATFKIDSATGNLVLDAVPASWFSFEGISFSITRP